MSEPIWQLEYEDTSGDDDLDPDWWWTGYIDAPSLSDRFDIADVDEDAAIKHTAYLNGLYARIAELESELRFIRLKADPARDWTDANALHEIALMCDKVLGDILTD